MRLARPRALAALVALVVLLAPSLAFADAPVRKPKSYTIEQFLATEAINGASFSADEKRILFSSNRTGIYNVYAMPVAGGAATALTDSKGDSTFAVSFFPHDDRFLFTRDKGGNELNHLFVKGTDGSEKDLTPGEKLKAVFLGWNRAGDAFYVQTNERDARYFDVYRYDAKTYERKTIYQDDKGWQLGAMSDDERFLAFAKPNTTADSDMYLWDAKTKEATLLSKHDGLADYSPQDFDPDGSHLYYLTNDGGELTRVRRTRFAPPLASEDHREVPVRVRELPRASGHFLPPICFWFLR